VRRRPTTSVGEGRSGSFQRQLAASKSSSRPRKDRVLIERRPAACSSESSWAKRSVIEHAAGRAPALRFLWAAARAFQRWLRATKFLLLEIKGANRQAGRSGQPATMPPAAVLDHPAPGPSRGASCCNNRARSNTEPNSQHQQSKQPRGNGLDTQPGEPGREERSRTHVGSRTQKAWQDVRASGRGAQAQTGSPSRANRATSSLPTWARCQQRPSAWPWRAWAVWGTENTHFQQQRFGIDAGRLELPAAGWSGSCWGRAGPAVAQGTAG